MPAFIAYRDALRAMRQARRDHDRLYRPDRRHTMAAAEREKLGALVVERLSKISEAREGPTGDVEFVVETSHGPLVSHYDVGGGSIFQRFERPTARVLGSNPHSGKWNFHYGRDDLAADAFLTWWTALASILPQP